MRPSGLAMLASAPGVAWPVVVSGCLAGLSTACATRRVARYDHALGRVRDATLPAWLGFVPAGVFHLSDKGTRLRLGLGRAIRCMCRV